MKELADVLIILQCI